MRTDEVALDDVFVPFFAGGNRGSNLFGIGNFLRFC